MSIIEKVNNRFMSNLTSYLSQWLPDGKIEGHEYVARNPTRGDSKHGSFKVNIHNCVWKDFALNEKGGNDPVSLYAYLRSLPMGEAAKELADSSELSTSKVISKAKSPSKSKEDDWTIVLPVPTGAPKIPYLSKLHWVYRDANGKLLKLIERHNLPDGEKEFKPWTLWSNKKTGRMKWKRKMIPAPRPLYGLELLGSYPTGAVLLVEGEKACDAARKLVPWAICMSWPGGANAIENIDWSSLKGRAVAIWPDNDDVGMVAASGGYKEVRDPKTGAVKNEYYRGIADRLHGSAQYVKIVKPPSDKPKGWDLADALAEGWSADRVKNFIKDNSSLWEPPAQDVPSIEPDIIHEADDDIPEGDIYPEDLAAYAGEENLLPDPAPARVPTTERMNPNLPHRHPKNGKTLANIENLTEMLRRLGVIARYNVISKEEELLIPNKSFSIDNMANASHAWILSECARFSMPTEKVSDFLTYISDQNPYNPVCNWIKSKPWDGKSRLESLYATVVAVGEKENEDALELKKVLMRRWMISAIAAAFNPSGVSAHGVLVFQGHQYLGKTQWFKSLVPKDLGVISDGVILKPDDRDSVKQAVSFWMIELGELDATFRKSDIAQLKSFLTKDKDILRKAYARKESTFARRTVFFASVNPKNFLHDSTGNRRFWTIECADINHEHGIDMQQLWAEVWEQLYKKGETWFLTHDEMLMLNDHNENFESKEAIEERIVTDFNWDAPENLWKEMTATDALRSIGIDRPTQMEKTKASQIIFKMNGGKKRKTKGLSMLLIAPRAYQPGIVP